MKIVKGDLIKMALNGEFDVIVHGANCFCKMGAGIASQIKKSFPKAYESDCETRCGDRSKLGEFSWARCSSDAGKIVMVINAYTQYEYGVGKIQVDYDAVRSCLRDIAQRIFRTSGKRIGMPWIGCGLAGGDREIVRKIIEDEMTGVDVTVVEL